MSDPFTAIVFALQAIFTPAPALEAMPPKPDLTVLAAASGPSWAPPQNWSLSQLPKEEAGQVPRFTCELRHKGDAFSAVVVADAALTVDYELKLRSTGANTLKVTRSDTLSLDKGRNSIDFNARLRVGSQNILGDLTLSDGGDRLAHCATS